MKKLIGGRGNGKREFYEKILREKKPKRIGQNGQSKEDITNTEDYIEFVTNSFYADGKEKGNE